MQQPLDRLLVDADVERADVTGGRILLLADRHAVDQADHLVAVEVRQQFLGAHRHQPVHYDIDRLQFGGGHALLARGDGILGGDIDGNLGDVIETVGRLGTVQGNGRNGQDRQRDRPRPTLKMPQPHIQLCRNQPRAAATPRLW